MMKVLVVGATGMLGYSLFSNLSEYPELQVFGSVRAIDAKEHYFDDVEGRLFFNVDVSNSIDLERVINSCHPDVVINCVGLIKQHEVSKLHVDAVKINALLPHQLAVLCDSVDAKLIHFSTDCIFDGTKGLYLEDDLPTARDLYGRSKSLGEVNYKSHLTLRTSIIGHELASSVSLVDWFLSQNGKVNGFSKAVFSGLPTCYIAKLLAEAILPLPKDTLKGLVHLSADPIDKFSLISIIADVYKKDVEIARCEHLEIDRSLNSSRLRSQLNLRIPGWQKLIEYMHLDFEKRYLAWRS